MRVLISGANGFVGRALLASLKTSSYDVVAAVRNQCGLDNEVIVGHINHSTNWSTALSKCEVVAHLAARVHVLHDRAKDPLSEFRKVNVSGTLNFAHQAAKAGVRRFIFLSSAKVNGEFGSFSATDKPHPQDAYAISKWEAECGLHEIARDTGMEVVILRPPLIYGPGVGANFLRLIQAVDRGFPLPLGSIHNKRSFIFLENLVDAIKICLTHSDAAGNTYLIRDDENVSTPELIRQIASALNRAAILVPVPTTAMMLIGRLLGKEEVMQRLFCSLIVENDIIQRDLGWKPPFSMPSGILATINWYRQR